MKPRLPAPGLVLSGRFVTEDDYQQVLAWLSTLRPLWEYRFSTVRPLPAGESQRRLHRPVYWLGNWQFACLGYYHPPHIAQRCVAAEPFPPVLERWRQRMEQLAWDRFPLSFVPDGWHLNTCLVNFYGSRKEGQRAIDQARVGSHRDFEPGPVGSISLGERALFQFTRGDGTVVEQRWLDDRSLALFAGPTFKDKLFHRVQRVDRRGGFVLPPEMPDFVTRRVNFTFRYVPPEVIVPYARLSPAAQADIVDYVTELARSSAHWDAALRQSEELA